ncbi:MAG TPA: deaminase [Chitinophagaceae bacterium]|nr:deaminase [Chitinophagaceae bacterium]
MNDNIYMRRCLELAAKGAGLVAPNPLVGAVIVCEDKIIGEGWHQRFGEAHAEVNAVKDAIDKGNEKLLKQSSLYVNLEPCSHHGKTPPCTDLIIKKEIREVVIGTRDPFEQRGG